MEINAYTVVMGLLWFTIVSLLSGWMFARSKGDKRLAVYAVIVVLCLLRIILPYRPDWSYILRDDNVYSFVQSVWDIKIYGEYTVLDFLVLVWLAGAVIALASVAKQLFSLHVVCKRAVEFTADSREWKICVEIMDEMGMKGQKRRCRLAKSSDFSSAVSVGYFHLHILLPENIDSFTTGELRNIFRHEMTHFKEGDLWIKLLFLLVRGFLWWNPAGYYLFLNVEQMLELRCDRNVCRNLDEYEKIDYMEAIMHTLSSYKNKNCAKQLSAEFTSAVRENYLRQRYHVIMDEFKENRTKRNYFLIGLCVLIFGLSYLWILYPGGPPDLDTITRDSGTEVYMSAEGDSCLICCPDGTYLFVDDYCNVTKGLTKEEIGEVPLEMNPILNQMANEAGSRQSDDTKWVYRNSGGKRQKRLWSENRKMWLAGWINCDPVEKLKICTDAYSAFALETVVDAWEKLNDGAQVEWVIIPSDADEAQRKIQKLRMEIVSGGGPDVFILPCTSLEEAEEVEALFSNPEKEMYAGTFLPLDQYMDEAEYMNTDEWNPAFLEAGRTEEGQFLLPLYYEYCARAFQTADCADAGKLPSSWNELITCEDKVIEEEMTGKLLWEFPNIFGRLADYQEKKLLFSEEELLMRIQEVIQYGEREPNEGSITLTSKAAASGQTNDFFFDSLMTDEERSHTIFAFPNVEGGVTANVTMYAAINSKTKQPKDAFSFLDMLFSNEIMSGSGFWVGDQLWGSAFMCPEGISVDNDALQYTYKWISENDMDTLQDINNRINVVRYESDLERILLKLYLDCVNAADEAERRVLVEEAYHGLQMKLME